jgi:hypothetical protein
VQSRHALQLPARPPRQEDPHHLTARRSAQQSTKRRREEQGRLVVPTCPTQLKDLAFVRRRRGKTQARHRRPLPLAAASIRPTSIAGAADRRLQRSPTSADRDLARAGAAEGRAVGPLNRNNPDGKPQIIQCHEINYHNDRLYLAWRDAGFLVLDIKDRTAPRLLASYDYVPPYHGGFLGAAHSSLPIVHAANEHPDIVVHTDEIFDCPQGSGASSTSRISNPVVKGRRQRAAAVDVPRLARAGSVRSAEEGIRLSGKGGPPGVVSTTRLRGRTSARRAWSMSPGTTKACARSISIRSPRSSWDLSPLAAPRRIDRHTRDLGIDTGLLYRPTAAAAV